MIKKEPDSNGGEKPQEPSTAPVRRQESGQFADKPAGNPNNIFILTGCPFPRCYQQVVACLEEHFG